MEGRLACSMNILQLHVTFNCGQCYRWLQQLDGTWVGVFHHCVWVIKHENGYLLYKVHGNIERLLGSVKKTGQIFDDYCNIFKISQYQLSNEDVVRFVIWEYFRLFENLEGHYKRWSLCDSNFSEKANKFYGLRMLKQEPEEILFTFICSSNTTISRISKMVEKLCSLYGEKICDLDGVPYYDFPDTNTLANSSDVEVLKKEKFGYRAEYIVNSANKIETMGGTEWFKELSAMEYRDAKNRMMELPGVGEKVADCICLMGLDHLNAIPVDTHVFQISKQYIPELRGKKSVSRTVYKQIGDFFRALFGHYAGWAHVVLFCADLKMHQVVANNPAGKIRKKPKKHAPKILISKYFNAKIKQQSGICTD